MSTLRKRRAQQISVSGMLLRKGKLLVVRRAPRENFLPNVFEFPGGKIHFGESPLDATKREFQEETQLAVSVKALIGVRSYLRHQQMQHVVELFYLVTESECREIVLSREHDIYRWITDNDLEDIGWASDDPVKQMSRLLFQQQNRFPTYSFPITVAH